MSTPHISRQQLSLFASGELPGDEATAVQDHLSVCTACAADMAALAQFSQSLDADWNSTRLAAAGFAHPSSSRLEAYWMGEAEEGDASAIAEHLAECDSCSGHIARLEDGLAALNLADPLEGPRWSGPGVRKFAAGIEMIVEAAHGAFTSAAGMVREAMGPQSVMRLAPTASVAMGRPGTRPGTTALWHDASFQTDQVSGEVSGSSDSTTGRGIITVLIHKSGDYVAGPPIVDLVGATGAVVATQSALDIGDRYSCHFVNLDEGHYLVGIREHGG